MTDDKLALNDNALRLRLERGLTALGQDLADVGAALGNVDETLRAGLPGGVSAVWGYDEQLVRDLAGACRAWRARRPSISAGARVRLTEAHKARLHAGRTRRARGRRPRSGHARPGMRSLLDRPRRGVRRVRRRCGGTSRWPRR